LGEVLRVQKEILEFRTISRYGLEVRRSYGREITITKSEKRTLTALKLIREAVNDRYLRLNDLELKSLNSEEELSELPDDQDRFIS